MDRLNATIAEWRRGKFEWGQSDCLLSVGDYLAAAGYVDIASHFRGTYSTEREALEHVDEHDGHAGLIDLTGAPRVGDPQRGDVVVIWTGETEVAGLFTGDTIVLRLERGTIEVNARMIEIIAAWRV